MRTCRRHERKLQPRNDVSEIQAALLLFGAYRNVSAVIDRHQLTGSLDLVGIAQRLFRQGDVRVVPSAGPPVGCFCKC